MKKTLIFLLLIVNAQAHIGAQHINVTDSMKISLLTCSPGQAAYEKFGHTALRIYDTSQSVDWVANWGLFDFSKPGFYYKFVKGETYYTLGIYDTDYFLESYRQRNSEVTEQFINLTGEEKKQLLDAVMTNYLPENREYLYNFVFDNCATRPRDLIVELYNGYDIQYHFKAHEMTFREWITHYTGAKSWLMFGIDLVFGRDADREATRWEAMFLPQVLSDEFNEVTLHNNDNPTRKLISEKRVIVHKTNTAEANVHSISPFITMVIIFILGLLIMFYEYKRKVNLYVFDSLLLIITGLAGIIIFYLMFFSIHPLVKMNCNVLWCNPLNIITGILILFFRKAKILHRLQVLNFFLFLFSLVAAALSVQVFNIAFLPLISLLLLRSLFWLRKTRYMQTPKITKNILHKQL